MEQTRHSKLDGFGEAAGEGLDKINEGTEEVNEARAGALTYMSKHDVETYVAAGVRFVYTKGVEKVSVKRVKPAGDNAATDADAGGEE